MTFFSISCVMFSDLGLIFGDKCNIFPLSTAQIEFAAPAARASMCNLLLAWLSDSNVMSLIH